jgi:hypothetical protein
MGGAMKSLVPVERIEKSILLIRGHRVMLDADLAELYGVTTKRLNEQVKAEVVANCDHLKGAGPMKGLGYGW